jgi:PAS domain S-box-containing protein
MQWQFTPYIIPLLIATSLAGVLAIAAWQRSTTGARVFAVMLAIVTAWSLGYALELSGADLASKILWGKVQYLAITTLPVAWFSFALHFTQNGHHLTRRNLAVLLIIPLLTLLLVWSNERHHLVWQQLHLDSDGPFVALQVSYGAWFWLHLGYSYLLLLSGTLLLLRMLLRSVVIYRRQTILLLLGLLIPWLGNGLYIFGLEPIPNLDLTPFAFTLSGVAMGWAFYRYRLLHIAPIAHQTIIDTMSDCLLVIDDRNRIIELNPAAQRILGCTMPEAIGQPAETILAKWPSLVNRYDDSSPMYSEIVLADSDPPRTFDMQISPLYNRQKRRSGRLIVLRDITARKQTEQALARARDQALEASRLKSELLAKVSHELRTPLGAILGFSEMLALDVYGPLTEEQRRTTTEIMDSTHYLSQLVSELLDQAQLDNNKLTLNYRRFAPADLIETVQQRLTRLAQAKGLTLTTHLAAELPAQLWGDSIRLQQILINLVNNAIKFTERGAIAVELYCPDAGHWALRVTDTGCGIPPEAQDYIFEPFRQVDGSSTREHSGSGLGLSIVRQLTSLMGGEIILASQPGRGSSFTVLLPLHPLREAATNRN